MSLIKFKEKIQVPADWKFVPIGNVLLDSQYGTSNETSDSGVPIVGMKNLQNGKVDFSELAYVALDEKEKEKLLLKSGDILLNRTNSYELVGKTGYVEQDCDVVFASYLVRLKVDQKKSYPRFVAIWLSSSWADTMIKKIATRAVSQANVNPTEFKKYCLIPLPPLSEQKAIADLLATWDEAIEKTEKLVVSKEKFFKSTVQKLITQNQRNGSWGKQTLYEVFDIKTGNSKSNYIDNIGQYYVLDMGAVSINGNLLATKRTSKTDDMLNAGDLIMAKDDIGGGNIIGKVVMVPSSNKYILGDHVYKLSNRLHNNEFLSYLINSESVNRDLKRKANGTSQLGLNKKDVENQIVYIPKVEEQKIIALLLTLVKKEICILQHEIYLLKKQKRGLMQKLLTGTWRIKPEIIEKYTAEA